MSALAAMKSDKARLVKAATSPGKKEKVPCEVHLHLLVHSAAYGQALTHRLLQPPASSEDEPPHKDPSLVERVEAEVKAEIDKAEQRKVLSAESRIVAYSDSDSEDDLPFKRSKRRAKADAEAQSRHALFWRAEHAARA